MARILVLHGDVNARRAIVNLLEQENFTAIEAENAEMSLRLARAGNFQLILLDLPLPGVSGVELCMQLRASQVQAPIMALSYGDEVERILLLETGADDCMIKPFGTRELLARTRALLRRAVKPAQKTFRFSEIEIDTGRRAITRSGKQISVTPCEYKLLLFFIENADRPLTRDLLLNSVWGYDDYPNTRTVDAHVMKLRSKLEPDPSVPRHFLTIHGIGYRFLM